jgi:two-component sensor histidine kinase
VTCLGVDLTSSREFEEALKASLREKTSLLKEVHHRVKNNLQIVSSLVSLQAGKFTDPKVLTALGETRDRVRGIALLHETLYRSESFAQLDFTAYVSRLCEQITKSAGLEPMRRVRIQTELAEVNLNLEQAVPCGLLLNELVTNALKHAFPGNRTGQVSVVLNPVAPENPEVDPDGTVRLVVRDDGVGLPDGFDARQTPSLGMRLVATLTDQLNGQWQIRQEGAGTTHEVSFPLRIAPRTTASDRNPGCHPTNPITFPTES